MERRPGARNQRVQVREDVSKGKLSAKKTGQGPILIGPIVADSIAAPQPRGDHAWQWNGQSASSADRCRSLARTGRSHRRADPWLASAPRSHPPEHLRAGAADQSCHHSDDNPQTLHPVVLCVSSRVGSTHRCSHRRRWRPFQKRSIAGTRRPANRFQPLPLELRVPNCRLKIKVPRTRETGARIRQRPSVPPFEG